MFVSRNCCIIVVVAVVLSVWSLQSAAVFIYAAGKNDNFNRDSPLRGAEIVDVIADATIVGTSPAMRIVYNRRQQYRLPLG